MPVKGRDDGNNLHDVYTTNESLSILQQAIDSGSMQGIDPSLNPVVEAIKESHANNNLTFWQGTEAEFNELGVSGEILGAKIDSNGKIYVLTGDTTLSDAVTNAADAAEAAAEQVFQGIKGTVLFESTVGRHSITLNDSVNNYDYLDIFTGMGAYPQPVFRTPTNGENPFRAPVDQMDTPERLTEEHISWSYWVSSCLFSGNTVTMEGQVHLGIYKTNSTSDVRVELSKKVAPSLLANLEIFKVIGYKFF